MREAILEKCRSSLGREHPQTLFAMNELAISSHFYDNRRDQAVKMQEETVALRCKVIGLKHPDTLQSMSNLAQMYHAAARWDDTLKLLKQVCQFQDDVLGFEHPSAIWSAVNYAYACVEADRIEEVLPLLKELTSRQPADSLQVLKVITLLAWLGLATEHEAMCRRALQQATATNEPTIADRAAKGYCMLPSQDSELLEAALAFARHTATIGQNDPYLTWYQMGLGMAEYRKGNFAAADQALTAAENGAEQMRADDLRTSRRIQGNSRLYRAMIAFRQSKRVEASELFFFAEALMNSLPEEGQPFKEAADHDDLICWLAYKEAKALIFPEQ